MKKILLSLCALLLVAGCSDAHAKLNDGKTVLLTVGDQAITKSEVYNTMVENGSGYVAISKATEIILDKEVPLTDEITASANESFETYKTIYGESLDSALQSYGYKDADDFYNNSLVISARLTELSKKYVNENFDALVALYKPKQATVLTFSTEDDAVNAKAALEAGSDALVVASEFNSSSAGSPRIVTTETDLDTAAKSYIQNATEAGLSDVIIGSEVENFYIIQIVETDVTVIHDDVVTTFMGLPNISTDSDLFFFKKYGFKVYDRAVYDNIQTNYADYIFN